MRLIIRPIRLRTFSDGQIPGVLFSQYKNKKKAMYQAAHHEMVAGAMVVKKGHQINPDFSDWMHVFVCPVLSIFLQSR